MEQHFTLEHSNERVMALLPQAGRDAAWGTKLRKRNIVITVESLNEQLSLSRLDKARGRPRCPGLLDSKVSQATISETYGAMGIPRDQQA